MTGKNTPTGVVLIGVVFVLFGFSSLLGGVRLVLMPSWAGWLGPVFGIVLLAAAAIELMGGIGCLLGRSWAWILVMLLLICGILMQVFFLVSWIPVYMSMGNTMSSLYDITWYFWPLFMIALTAAVLYYFYQPHVRVYFYPVE